MKRVIAQVDHACSGVGQGVVASNESTNDNDNGGGVIERVDQVHSDVVVIVEKNIALQGSILT